MLVSLARNTIFCPRPRTNVTPPQPKREPIARRSLEFFLQYVDQSGRDPHTLGRNLARLNVLYERPYPVLREQILASLRNLNP